jgi:hypothetical protein
MAGLADRLTAQKRKGKLKGRSLPSQHKAKEILKDGTIRGKAITKKQRGFFGILASGRKPTLAK